MNNEVELIKVNTDDYEVLYANGKLVFEEDSLNLSEVINYLVNKHIVKYVTYYIKQNKLAEVYNWSFPNDFNEFDVSHLK
ncbi:hypothetical protein FJQ98_15940 [Lysinibacillus agricola]|uniref:Uncharacterized protein n=1 Tax=Lysinibacillus agricola TaxID=2590012 RepID=A0ABX7AMM3_9BACI|nr:MULTISPECIES: hypothetical protein [Lysinibacillus]KOS61562.1 hypothetical protein AN161_18420 [Lysinibacillus sp. FJAT-14222]QQP10736.1 hypothetical protein FJQ98_15940 [Lysinibacillus agricola]